VVDANSRGVGANCKVVDINSRVIDAFYIEVDAWGIAIDGLIFEVIYLVGVGLHFSSIASVSL